VAAINNSFDSTSFAELKDDKMSRHVANSLFAANN